MLEKIIEWSLKNKFFVILGTIFAIAWGAYSLKTIPLDAIPDLTDVQVIILTEYPGQAPRVVEDQITYPITTQMLACDTWSNNAELAKALSSFAFDVAASRTTYPVRLTDEVSMK